MSIYGMMICMLGIVGITHHPKTILIDPGHGGADPGAVSVSGHYEKELNLSLALRVASKLKLAGWQVSLTRSLDMEASLSERVALANVSEVSLFLSIHHDSSENPDARGSTIFVAPKASDMSIEVAKALSARMPLQHNRGVKQENFMVLTRTKCPAVLLEMGFLSNEEDERLMLSIDWEEMMSTRITEALESAWKE